MMSPFAVILLLVFFWLITLVLILWSLLTPRRSTGQSTGQPRERPARAHARERALDPDSDLDDAHRVSSRRGVRVVADTAVPTAERSSSTVRVLRAQTPPAEPLSKAEARAPQDADPSKGTPQNAPPSAERNRARADDRAFERFMIPKNDDLEL